MYFSLIVYSCSKPASSPAIARHHTEPSTQPPPPNPPRQPTPPTHAGEHSPLEDAVAALRLYKLHAAEWERSHKQSKGEPTAKKRRKLAAAAAAAAGDAGGGDAGEDVADEVSVGGAGAGVGASGRPTSGPGRKPYKQIGSKKRKVLKLGEAKRGAKRS